MTIIQLPPPAPSDIPPEAVELARMFFVTVAVLALGIPLIRAFTRRFANPASKPVVPPELTARLDRIEQAIDAVAIEVERIAEAQRFTAKLQAEQAAKLPPPS